MRFAPLLALLVIACSDPVAPPTPVDGSYVLVSYDGAAVPGAVLAHRVDGVPITLRAGVLIVADTTYEETVVRREGDASDGTVYDRGALLSGVFHSRTNPHLPTRVLVRYSNGDIGAGLYRYRPAH